MMNILGCTMCEYSSKSREKDKKEQTKNKNIYKSKVTKEIKRKVKYSKKSSDKKGWRLIMFTHPQKFSKNEKPV